MAIGNLGATMQLLEGFLASDFAPATYNRNQGSALIPEMVRMIASRADLTYTNLRVSPPTLNAATEQTIESGAVGVIALIAASNATQAEDAAVLLYEAAVTEGTTRYCVALNVDAANTTATGTMYYAIFPQPIPMAALYVSAVDNGADGDIEGTGLADVGGIKWMVIYAE